MILTRAVFALPIVAVGSGAVAARRVTSLTLRCDTFAETASITSLQRAFGTADIGTDSLPLGPTEGDMVPATVLFSHDPQRRIAIVWQDTVAKRTPRFVLLRHAPTEWTTREGITVGTPLRELERLNGRPFHLAGFAFDGAGAVTSWDGGKLASLSTGSCRQLIFLDSLGSLGPAARRRYREVVGDKRFSSGHPAMQALNPRVSEILLEYR